MIIWLAEKFGTNLTWKILVIMDHYLKKDVLLLADVSGKFIDTCWKFHKLDPCHYFGSPGLSWDAMLKMTGVELKKNLGIDLYLFLEKGTRGRISWNFLHC